ncbi:hypothetical protein HELRODRAFT_103204 [Helobdella robusta]|uniref:Vang-like protein n=1 Tax=Helobdella robusta TaxID=6412 RepID=T1EDF0_HELRO|nr:hypothetical protein HELRODRAFT_103204 [Helobdella robusta]ESN93864.1 hypothetical protein HELRODRAFT_103204 [Helobdella robusta]
MFKSELSKNKSFESTFALKLFQYAGFILFLIISLTAIISPIVMIVLPKLEIDNWRTDVCSTECEGMLISFIIKSFLLFIGSWVLFWRRPEYNMPRASTCKAFILILIFVITSLHWLFYGVKFLSLKDANYLGIVSFASTMIECQIFVHYLAVVLLEIKQLKTRFAVKIVRSPDGLSKCYQVGQMSVQQLAVWCLHKYHSDFEHYNVYLNRMITQKCRTKSFKISQFKLYDIDSSEALNHLPAGTTEGTGNSTRRKVMSCRNNERFYQEDNLERKIRKRKSRLMQAAEDAFNNIRSMQQDAAVTSPIQMSPRDAAQAIFAGLANPLQKYLRTTRQQPKYTVENIVEHITHCLAYNLSAKVFVERYLSQGNVVFNEEKCQNWVIISQSTLNRGVIDGVEFCLKRGEITIMVSVTSLPFLKIFEGDVRNFETQFVICSSGETRV